MLPTASPPPPQFDRFLLPGLQLYVRAKPDLAGIAIGPPIGRAQQGRVLAPHRAPAGTRREPTLRREVLRAPLRVQRDLFILRRAPPGGLEITKVDARRASLAACCVRHRLCRLIRNL